MTIALDITELSMINDLRQLDIISHNLANANTAGFKRDVALTRVFDQLLSGEIQAWNSSQMVDLVQMGALENKHSLMPEMKIVVDHASGALQYTGNPLDIAIEGEGYFELWSEQGIRYSRGGAFSIDASGRLANSQGMVVGGENGDIRLQSGDITVDRNGLIRENGERAGQLKLVRFTDPSVLIKVGMGVMKAPAHQVAHPLSQRAGESGIRQGYQEASNVDAAEEMVKMMSALRHFESASRIIKGYDEMIGTAISTIAEF